MATRFRLLFVLGLATVLLEAVSGVMVLQADTERQATRFAALDQRVVRLQSQLDAFKAVQTKTDAAATALGARITNVERSVRILNLTTDLSTQLNDLQDQINGLDDRISATEVILGSARNRYCRFGIVDCINSLVLRFGP